MWLASFRLAEVVALDHPLNPLRRELRLHGLCEEIVLDPFSETEVAEYVAKRSPSVANDEAFVRALHERTDGLPLFVASIMSEMGARAAQGGGRVATEQVAKIAVPENLAAIIEHYIAKLENEQRTVLSAAAVCGVQFRVNTIAAALEQDAAWVGDICDELAREQLWLVAPRAEEGGDDAQSPYSFRHALFRQVLYERTAPSARAQLHRKIGAALERERAARVPVTAPSSPCISSEAARRRPPFATTPKPPTPLLRTSAPKSACRIIERALPLLEQAPDGPERNALQITLATLHGLAATRVLGAGSEAKSAFQRAYSLLDEAPQHPMRARLLHGFGFMLTLRAEYAEALAVADRAEALGSITNDPVLLSTACTVHGQVDQLQGRPRAARTWLERGLALSERLDVGPGEFLVDPQVALLGMLAVPLVHLGSVEHARTCVQRALSRARDRKWPMARLVAIWYSALFEVRLGNTERVAALADEMHALVDEFALAHGRTRGAGFTAGRTLERARRTRAIKGFGTRTKRTRGSECWRARARSSAMRPRRSSSQATSTERRSRSTKRYRPPTSSASACICRSSTSWRLRSLVRVASAQLPKPRFDARSRGESPRGAVARADGADRTLRARTRDR